MFPSSFVFWKLKRSIDISVYNQSIDYFIFDTKTYGVFNQIYDSLSELGEVLLFFIERIRPQGCQFLSM